MRAITKAHFTINVPTRLSGDAAEIFMAGKEVLVEVAEIHEEITATDSQFRNTQQPQRRTVTFQSEQPGGSLSILNSRLQGLPRSTGGQPSKAIEDLCSSLGFRTSTALQDERHVGLLVDKLTKRRHDVYAIRSLPGEQLSRSVEEVLSDLSSYIKVGPMQLAPISRRNRRFLAATLATSLLQFHGSWLTADWGLADILLPAAVDCATKKSISLTYLETLSNHPPPPPARH